VVSLDPFRETDLVIDDVLLLQQDKTLVSFFVLTMDLKQRALQELIVLGEEQEFECRVCCFLQLAKSLLRPFVCCIALEQRKDWPSYPQKTADLGLIFPFDLKKIIYAFIVEYYLIVSVT
jgi:hypothetical protein